MMINLYVLWLPILQSAVTVFVASSIIHTDLEHQYGVNAYQVLMREHGLIFSVTAKSNCRDNAEMERWSGSLKGRSDS